MPRRHSHTGTWSCLFRALLRQFTAYCAIALAIACLSTPMLAQDAVLTDDAQTSANRPNRNFGAGGSLHVLGGNDRVFIKFSLPPNLPLGTVGSHVGKATLKLFVNTVSNSGPLGVATVSGAWSEATITEANAPAVGALLGSFNIDPTQHGQWLTLDVTQQVKDWVDNVSPNDGIVLFAAPGGADLSFDSKENTNTSHQPQLEIVLNHAATAGSADTATNATELGGVPAGNFVKSGDPVLTGARTPLPGSPDYIQNTPPQQQSANFNISGSGTLGGTLSADKLNANTQFNLGGQRFLTQLGSIFTESLLMGVGAGQNETLFADGSGRENTFIGARAGLSNTIGINNSFLGHTAGAFNQTGNFNTYAGHSAGYSNVGGQLNAAFGAGAGTHMTGGSENSFLGAEAGDAGITGKDNTFIGFATGFSEAQFNAGQATNMGTGNTLLGANAGLGTASLDHATAIGADAVVSTSNTIMLGRLADIVQVPGSLKTNTVSANVVNAANEFELGGFHILSTAGFQNTFLGMNAGTQNSGPFNSFFGTLAGNFNTSGSANSFFGDTASEQNTTGSENSSFGSGAGFANQTGTANSLFGYHSGIFSTGSFNSFFGRETGANNTTGHDNTFFGDQAGFSNTTGIENTYFGDAAGYFTTTAGQNSFFGRSAGQQNTTGAQDTFIGYTAGFNNTTATRNTFVGNQAGYNNLDGESNSFLGSGAGLANTSGKENTFYGRHSGLNNTIGSQNAFFGNDAGSTNVQGNSLTLIGKGADVSVDGLVNATALGVGAIVSQSNSLVLGNNVNVGIRTSAPGSPLTVLGLIETDSATGGVKFPDGSIQKSAGISGNVVRTLNGLINDVVLTPGSPNVIITQAGNAVSIAAHADATAILNQTVLQSPANFNIDGTGAANIFNAATEYDIAGSRVLSEPAGSTNLFAGFNAGAATDNVFSSANAFFGFDAGRANTQGSDNTYVGNGAGRMTQFGADNSYFGASAGSEGVGGQRNSFFGASAGLKTTATDNSFFGYHAGEQNLGGTLNAFFGEQAGEMNDTGSNNSFFGTNAGEFNNGGSNNTFIGDFAGAANTTQANNTFVGYFAGATGGTKNSTAIGANAVVFQDNSLVLGSINGLNGATADTKVGIGTPRPTSKLTVVGMIETDSVAGGVTFPDGSVQTTAAVGAGGPVVKSLNGLNNDVVLAAGSNVTITPAGNTLTIASSGGAIPNAILNQTTPQAAANFNIDGTGTANILNVATQFNQGGSRLIAEADTLDLTSNLFAGLNAGASNVFTGFAFGVASTGFNNAYFGFEAGKNVIDGYENSYFGSQAGLGQIGIAGAGYENAAFGTYAGKLLKTGFGNAFFGYATGTHNDTGSENVFIGDSAGQVNTSGSNNTAVGANAGMPAGMTNLSFATAIGAGAIVDSSNTIVIGRPGDTVKAPPSFSPSDFRLKTNIANLNYGLRDLLELRPVTWKWKADANGRTQLGLIAQEVEPIIPELVLHGESKDRLLSMNYIGLLPIVVRAIQEQQATIDELRKQLVQQKLLGAPAISQASLGSGRKTTVIDGNVTTDERGEAIVIMPDCFDNLHSDFRYQLTVVGQFAQAIVAGEMNNNRFTIKTDKPYVKVSWQVKAHRNNYAGVEGATEVSQAAEAAPSARR